MPKEQIKKHKLFIEAFKKQTVEERVKFLYETLKKVK
jgi:hypothetical protein